MMKQTNCIILIAVLLAAGFLSACATNPPPAIDPQPIDQKFYAKKTDYLLFILDTSWTMASSNDGYRKLDIARAVIQNFGNTMPDVGVTTSLRSFGHARSVSSEKSKVLMPARTFSRTALTTALDKVQDAGGYSPLWRSLKDAVSDIKGVDGSVAVIIVSDGMDMASRTLADARALRAAHGGQFCYYTVQVGGAADGANLLGDIAAISNCGAAINADNLQSGQAMNAFVRNVLFTVKRDSDSDGVADDSDRCPATPPGANVGADGCRLDSDRDGVFDDRDACPGTAEGTAVDEKGCQLPVPEPTATESAEVTAAGTWLYKDIQFDHDSAKLKESSFESLNEIKRALEAQPKLNIEIHGHTDVSGARDYNFSLSRKRAEAVKAYLLEKGIEPVRMTTKGFGPDSPIESNTTKDGRTRNRRVEVKPIQ